MLATNSSYNKERELVLQLENDKYYILATSSYADDQTKVLNFGDTFAVFDRWGDAKQIGAKLQGIYHQDTRFISDLEFLIQGHRPMLLSSNVKTENEILSIDLTNPRIQLDNGLYIEKGMIHIARTKFLQEGICYESIILQNYDVKPCSFQISLSFNGDFCDIFEVRGMAREHRGEVLPVETTLEGHLKISYVGLDKIKRTTWIRFESGIEWIEGNAVVYSIRLNPGERTEIRYNIQFQVGESDVAPDTHLEAFHKIKISQDESKNKIATLSTDNAEFTNWINRSKFDLVSLLKHTADGLYPYAGVPWYNTTFGRDGIITAMEALWITPEIAKGVLLFLAANQAKTNDPFRDAEPGKILHEARGGEMAILHEVPFYKYYGTIDATPLFVSLAGQYYKRTGDKACIQHIWSNIKAALEWIEKYGDVDGDGFVEYEQKQKSGLFNQGWKDSHDCISHEDGTLAQPSIALCEVQGYVYDAYVQAAYLAELMAEADMVKMLKQKAKKLKKDFNETFWDKALQCFVVALDKEKKPCRIKTSNAGQCLFSGIVTPRNAAKLVKTLMNRDLFSGWGIRTLSSEAVRYNPMSYHNGSVWPHDTALIAAGMARYGYTTECMKLMDGLFKACTYLDLQRLPELFCGFAFREGEAPTAYPVACIPQAWSVASIFLLMQACLNIEINVPNRRLILSRPQLPAYINRLFIRDLKVPGGRFELELIRHKWDVGIHTISKPEDWQLVVYK